MSWWADLDDEGLVLGFYPEKPPAVRDGVRVIAVTDEQRKQYLDRPQERAFDSSGSLISWDAPTGPLPTQKKRKVGQLAIQMDQEIRGLLPLNSEESEKLPNYLEFGLAIQLNPGTVNTIWQHYQRKVAEIRAAADQSALEAINWRP